MRRIGTLAGLLMAACSTLSGCSDPGNSMAHAEQVGSGYYQALHDKDFQKASGFFLDKSDAPQAQWLAEIRDNNSKLGDLQSFKLLDESENTVYSGTRYILRYRTEYSKGRALETLVLFDRVSGIAGDSKGLGIENLVIKPDRP